MFGSWDRNDVVIVIRSSAKTWPNMVKLVLFPESLPSARRLRYAPFVLSLVVSTFLVSPRHSILRRNAWKPVARIRNRFARARINNGGIRLAPPIHWRY